MPASRNRNQRSKPELKQAAHRRCCVCDWETDQIEVVGIEHSDPSIRLRGAGHGLPMSGRGQ
jgi:hypothetical protein